MKNSYKTTVLVQLLTLPEIPDPDPLPGLVLNVKVAWLETSPMLFDTEDADDNEWIVGMDAIRRHSPFITDIPETFSVFLKCWFEATLVNDWDGTLPAPDSGFDVQSLKLLCGPCDEKDAVNLYRSMKAERDSTNGQPGIVAFFKETPNGK
ncbi:hypothetical protein [Lacticaseibacillus brantae]|uniref:hypothetical protein n=1 Tax=Lacticaseibacillus brantae TaxID=943673 RepID=UPI00070ECA3C|nr:hypothetical protein [Lacticaseibacillus brantae]